MVRKSLRRSSALASSGIGLEKRSHCFRYIYRFLTLMFSSIFSCHFQDSLSYVTSDINNDEVKEHKIKDEEVPDNDDQKGNGPDGNVFKRFQSKPVGKVMWVCFMMILYACVFMKLWHYFLVVAYLLQRFLEYFLLSSFYLLNSFVAVSMMPSLVMVSLQLIILPDFYDPSFLELNYAFGLFTGILLTSTFWFVLYCFCLKLRPKINPKLTVPALFSGVLFGIGNGN